MTHSEKIVSMGMALLLISKPVMKYTNLKDYGNTVKVISFTERVVLMAACTRLTKQSTSVMILMHVWFGLYVVKYFGLYS